MMQPDETIAYPWRPDQGDGTYRNPVICADYSDPDVIRDGEDFYLTASSFTQTPGLPILHSRDLVNWKLVNHALMNLPEARYRDVQPGCGVWAPAIRKHAGKFWIFFPMPDEGIYVTTAERPEGQWCEPWLLVAGKGLIDPCPLWDDDGKAYLVHAYANSRAGIKHQLRVRPMASDGSKLLGDGQVVFNDPVRHPTIEGPKFHKREGWYYVSAPAGGVATGWQVMLRSRNVYGPYEDKIVLAQGKTAINGPHQGALVDDVAGNEWFLHFQDADVYGRIGHLQPVIWREGWPVMGEAGEPMLQHRKPTARGQVEVCEPATSDEFESATLGLQWQWQANHEDRWRSLTARPGHLRLFARPGPGELALCPHALGQKFPARSFAVETRVEVGGSGDVQGGLVVLGRKSAGLLVERTTGAAPHVSLVVEGNTVESRPAPAGVVWLGVEVADGGKCVFRFMGEGGEWTTIGEAFQAVAGHWVGARVGLLARTLQEGAAGAYLDVNYFRFSRLGD